MGDVDEELHEFVLASLNRQLRVLTLEVIAKRRQELQRVSVSSLKRWGLLYLSKFLEHLVLVIVDVLGIYSCPIVDVS